MLYLVATPIGNLGDMSLRAIATLREADYIASEDTRKTGTLLKHFQIEKKKLIAFHEYNQRQVVPKITALLAEGKNIAVVTNAGTPAISDPGFVLVRSAIEAQIDVTMIPGPTAFVTALVLSALPVHAFTFLGFPPRKSSQRRRLLEAEKENPHTLVFYESPYRLRKFLTDALAVLGDRNAAIAKELTKMFESVRRGSLSQLIPQIEEKPKGEYVVVIAGKQQE